MVAKPKNDKKPNTSVIVVSITPEASAGSILNLFNVSGIKVPANPAIIRFKIMAKAITNPSKVSSKQ